MSRKIFSAEDVLKLQTIGQMQIAPDGSLVAYELKENDLSADEVKTNLWWVATAGETEAKCLTFSGKDSSPSWSHDSKRLAFISGRSGKPQIHLIDRAGGEALPLKTDCRPGGALLWSADDRYIAFTSRVEIKIEGERYPGEPENLWRSAAEELAGRAVAADKAKKDEKKKTTPVHVITEFEYRNDGRGLSYEQVTQLFVLDLQEGCCRQLTQIAGDDPKRFSGYVWSGEKHLIYVLERLNLATLRSESIFYSIGLECEAPTECFAFAGSANNLRFSPDGKTLLFSGTRAELPQGTAPSEIWIWREGMKEAISLTADLDRSCRYVSWGVKGETVIYLKEDHAALQIYRRSFAGDKLGEEQLLLSSNVDTIENISQADDGTLVYIGSAVVTPQQLYLKTGQNEQDRCLTKVNKDYLDEGLFFPAETLHFKGPEQWDIEGFVIRPCGYEEGKPVPTVLAIHGGPTGVFNRTFVPYFQMLAHAGFAVVYINPRGSISYGSKFAQGVCADWGGGDFGDIMAGLDLAIEKKIADPDKLGLMGWSYGGYMTCWGVTQTERFKAAIGGANISNIYTLYGNSDIGAAYDEALMGGPAFDLEELYMSRSAIRHVRKVTTPIMLLHGEADIRCPVDQSEQFYTALKRLGKEAVFVRYPEQYHGLTKPSYVLDRWQRTLAWFGHYLKK